jgi:hypothetical protein
VSARSARPVQTKERAVFAFAWLWRFDLFARMPRAISAVVPVAIWCDERPTTFERLLPLKVIGAAVFALITHFGLYSKGTSSCATPRARAWL